MSVTDLPKLVYINEPLIEQQVELLDEGRVEHIVEEYSESEEHTTSGGVNIYQVLRLEREKTSHTTENIAKKVKRTTIGQFAVYHGMIDEDGDLTEASNLDESDREQLADDEFVTITGSIRRTPLNLFDHLGEKFGFYGSSNIVDDPQVTAQIKDAADYYEMTLPNDLSGVFTFELNEAYFQPIEPEFPDEYQEYTVFGEVRHVYEQNEERNHIDAANYANVSDTKKRQEQRRRMKSMAQSASQLTGREISEDDYKISYPDIELTPIAIYR